MTAQALTPITLDDQESVNALAKRLADLELNTEDLIAEHLLVASNGETYLLDDITDFTEEDLQGESFNHIRFPCRPAGSKSRSALDIKKDPNLVKSLIRNKSLAEALKKVKSTVPTLDLDEVPACPINTVLFFPVIDIEEHHFDQAAIESWLINPQHHTCPISRAPLSVNDLIPNLALEDLIWLSYCQRQAQWNDADDKQRAALEAENKEMLGAYKKRFTTLKDQLSSARNKDEVYRDIVRANPALANKDSLAIAKTEKELQTQKAHVVTSGSHANSFFRTLTKSGFIGLIIAFIFLPNILAIPPLAIITGAFIVSSLMVGIIGGAINKGVMNHKVNKLEQKQEAVSLLKSLDYYPWAEKTNMARTEVVKNRKIICKIDARRITEDQKKPAKKNINTSVTKSRETLFYPGTVDVVAPTVLSSRGLSGGSPKI